MSYLEKRYAGNISEDDRKRLAERFTLLDIDNSGTLTYDEIVKALSTDTYHFPSAAAKALIRSINPQGFIDISGFMYVDRFVHNCQVIFKKMDQDESETLDETELIQALSQLGFTITPRTAATLLANFSSGNGAGLEYSAFVATASLCCLNYTLLQKFDKTGSGRITLGLDELSVLSLWYF